jgi:chromosome segregation ATPase
MCVSKSPLLSVLLAAAVLTAVMLTAPAFAAEKNVDRSKEQVRRLQQAQRQLEQEKAKLGEEKAAVEAELGEARKKAEAETRRAASLTKEVSALRTARDAVVGKLAESDAELRRTQEQLRLAEAEGKRLQAALTSEKQQLAVALERNKEIHKVSGEVLSLYEKKSCFDSAFQREPLTGLKRVEIENAVEDLRDKLDSQRAGS